MTKRNLKTKELKVILPFSSLTMFSNCESKNKRIERASFDFLSADEVATESKNKRIERFFLCQHCLGRFRNGI